MSMMECNANILDILDRLKNVKALKDRILKQETELVQALYNEVRENEIVVDPETSEVILTWKYNKDTKRLDTKKLMYLEPEIYEKYVKITPGARRLEIK